jgi:hypothetical protein
MIDGLKPYPEYRQSGIPWLGRIPSHWDVPATGGYSHSTMRPDSRTCPSLRSRSKPVLGFGR